MGQQGIIGAVQGARLLPNLQVFPLLAVDLGQGEGLPIHDKIGSAGFLNRRQPHGRVIDKGSTEIVVGGKRGVCHPAPPILPVSLLAGQLNCSIAELSGQERECPELKAAWPLERIWHGQPLYATREVQQ